MNAKEFFAALFDLAFERFVTIQLTGLVYALALGGGGQGDDGLPPLAPRRPPDEVQLAPEARVDAGADGVRHHLAGEVHLNGRVDGHHLAVLGDDEGVVHVVDGVELVV